MKRRTLRALMVAALVALALLAQGVPAAAESGVTWETALVPADPAPMTTLGITWEE